MFWFCGGHGQCAEGNGGEPGAGLDVGSILGSGGGDPRLEAASAAWLARYLKGDRSVKTGPGFEFRSDDRKYRVAPQYPVAPGKPVKARGSGHPLDRPRRDLGRSHVGRGGRRRRPRRAADGAQGRPAARPAEGHAHLHGHGRPGRRTGLRAADQRRTAAWWWATSRRRSPCAWTGASTRSRAGSCRSPPRRRRGRATRSSSWPARRSGRSSGRRARSRRRGSTSSCRWPIRAASGRSGRRCTTARSFRFELAKRLRGQVLDGRVLLRGRRVARVRGAGKGGRVQFARSAAGAQKLKLVLRLSDGRTITRKRTVLLCAPGS